MAGYKLAAHQIPVFYVFEVAGILKARKLHVIRFLATLHH